MLLGLFRTETSPGYLKRLLLVGLAAGVYPPVGLLCLTYFGLRGALSWMQDHTPLVQEVLKLTGFTAIFLLVLTPYWIGLLLEGGGSGLTDFVYALEYSFNSPGAVFETFLAGSRQALFRDTIHFDLFLGLLGLTVLQWLILTDRFRIGRRHGLLLGASLLLWGLAHLTHPLIYQPFKYTRMSLLLVLLLPFLNNLLATISRLCSELEQAPVIRWSGYAVAAGCLGLWFGFVTATQAFKVITDV